LSGAANYRLRGEVGGIVRHYAVIAGENWIGSTDGNAILLPVRGVSRRHALLKLGDEGLVLEDMGSKNGTLANGVRIQRTQLKPGDELRVGPVTLKVETIDKLDTVLAIEVSQRTPPSEGLASHDTTAVEDRGRFGLTIIEDLLVKLFAPPAGDVAGALALLVRETGARGGCVFTTERGDVVALAASGDVPKLGEEVALTAAARSEDTRAGSLRYLALAGESPLRLVLSAGPDGEAFGLCLAGELRASESDTELLLRIALIALLRTQRRETRAPAPHASRPPSRLVFPEGHLPGDSPAMSGLYAQIQPLVAGELPILLLGETGVGKEGLARLIHLSSSRAKGPFVAVNCAAIPAELLEAELFGVAKAAATGVVERKGRFQLAEGGTLFLDEIGDMPLPLQAKLLRALQEKEIQPVGGPIVAVNIRVLAATNSDLVRRMDEGLFRRDLYYRVAGLALRVPPLRERRADVRGLVHAFVTRFAAQAGKSVRGVTIKAHDLLVAYSWPGNIRELEHEVRRLVHLCPDGQAIDSTMLSSQLTPDPKGNDGSSEPPPGGSSDNGSLDLEKSVADLERRLIERALVEAGGNRTQAAKLLGISRNGLAIKMERLGLKD
jgi:two-component system response regulator AtoC